MVKRFTEEQFIQRVNYLWEQFHTRPEMYGVSYEDFKKDCLEEFKKQNEMSDDKLDIYRKNTYNKLIKQVNELTTQEEKEKLNSENDKTITIQDEMQFKN